MIKKSVFTLITSFIAISPMGLALPSIAANPDLNLNCSLLANTYQNCSFSSIGLNVGFTQFPEYVVIESNIDIESSADTEDVEALVEINFLGNAFFVEEPNSISTFPFYTTRNFKTSILRRDSNSLGRVDNLLKFTSGFEVPTQTTLNFLIQANALLENHTRIDDLPLSPLSAAVGLNLMLRNVSQQEDLNLLKFLGMSNVGLTEELSRDWFSFKKSPSLYIIDSQETKSLDEIGKEKIELSLTALLEIKTFDEPLELELIARTFSCNYSSNIEDVCAKVSEPSNRFIWWAGIFWFVYKRLFSRIIMKKIVKFTG